MFVTNHKLIFIRVNFNLINAVQEDHDLQKMFSSSHMLYFYQHDHKDSDNLNYFDNVILDSFYKSLQLNTSLDESTHLKTHIFPYPN